MTRRINLTVQSVRRNYRESTLNLIYLAAQGMPPAQAATVMRMPSARAERILGSSRGKLERQEIEFKLSGQDPQKAFERLVPETIAVQAEVMRNKNEKGAVRVMAASAIQDRAMGKPKQQVEIEHKSVARQVLEAALAEKHAIPVDPRPALPPPADLAVPYDFPEDVPVPTEKVDAGQSSRDDVDEWLNQNL